GGDRRGAGPGPDHQRLPAQQRGGGGAVARRAPQLRGGGMKRYLAVGAVCLAACSAEETERGPAWQSASLLPPVEGPRLVVTNSGDDTLSFIDPLSFVEIARTPVGSSPVELEAAHHVAVSADGRSLFVGLANTVQSNAQASGPHGNH